jgi:hypothetical protein
VQDEVGELVQRFSLGNLKIPAINILIDLRNHAMHTKLNTILLLRIAGVGVIVLVAG